MWYRKLVVKSTYLSTHAADLRQAFTKMRQHDLKMNPAKCIFFCFSREFPEILGAQLGNRCRQEQS